MWRLGSLWNKPFSLIQNILYSFFGAYYVVNNIVNSDEYWNIPCDLPPGMCCRRDGKPRTGPDPAGDGCFLKTLSQEVTAAEKQSFQVPSFDGTRYSIPDASPYWEADSSTLVSRSMGRNEANSPCYTETREMLSPDGMLLTTVRMRKVRDSDHFLKKKFTGPFSHIFLWIP